MSTELHPQIYLITPPVLDPTPFGTQLQQVMDRVEVACVRLHLASSDESDIARAADTLREVTHARDVALVISDHLVLAERLGLDGVHLSDAARSVRAARKALGSEAIVGAQCGASRHDGMTAGEAGADYVSFGPVAQSALHDGTRAETDLFAWWSDMIELPVVAEGGLDPDLIRTLAPYTDFFGIGPEIWATEDPATALADLQEVWRMGAA